MSVEHPSKTKLGYEEYCLFPDDGHRHEIINGYHYMAPAPTPNHQTVSKRLLQVGVEEYWIVDPDDYVIKQLVLENGMYQEQSESPT